MGILISILVTRVIVVIIGILSMLKYLAVY